MGDWRSKLFVLKGTTSDGPDLKNFAHCVKRLFWRGAKEAKLCNSWAQAALEDRRCGYFFFFRELVDEDETQRAWLSPGAGKFVRPSKQRAFLTKSSGITRHTGLHEESTAAVADTTRCSSTTREAGKQGVSTEDGFACEYDARDRRGAQRSCRGTAR